MIKKQYVLWHEDVQPPKVQIIFDYWDTIKHVSRTGCRGFKKYQDAAVFADDLRQKYLNRDLAMKEGPTDNEDYIQNLVESE